MTSSWLRQIWLAWRRLRIYWGSLKEGELTYYRGARRCEDVAWLEEPLRTAVCAKTPVVVKIHGGLERGMG